MSRGLIKTAASGGDRQRAEHDCEACGETFALEDGNTVADHTHRFPDRPLVLCGLCLVLAIAGEEEDNGQFGVGA